MIILGHEARPGAVWLFARRAIDRLEGVLSQALPVSEQDMAPLGLLEGQRGQPDTLPGAKELPEGGAAMPGLVSFEEAVALGLVRFDVGRREGTFGAG